MRPILIAGGGHALVVEEAARVAGWLALGFFDDDPDALLTAILPRLGALADAPGPGPWILAMGSIGARREMLVRIAGEERRAATIVHPAATFSPTAGAGPGTFIGARAVVQARARLGPHAIVNTGAIVEHECEIGENVHIAPGAILGGRCTIGPDTLIGLGARVIPGIRIGSGCTIGAGATVIRDVEEGQTVVGTPARALSPTA